MNKARKVLAATAAAGALVAPTHAKAITNGTADEGAHPYVGALVSHDGRDRKKHLICSGTLISPTIFLTAAHCLDDEPQRLYVSFDAFVGAPEVGPEVQLYPGTGYADPAHVDPASAADPHDVAVIKLDAAVPGAEPATLPLEGALDGLGAPQSESWELVGYGREGKSGKQFYGGGSRRWATGVFASLEPAKLNLDQTGTIGGTCNGDSGGPVLLGGTRTVVGITSDGDPDCAATGVYYRTDTPSARTFLSQFVTLPERRGRRR